jgi:xanthine/CO dehydrogenase XdhC/CoxF family maturation factor
VRREEDADERRGRILGGGQAEEDLVIRVIEVREGGEVLQQAVVVARDGLEDADARRHRR